MDSTKKLTLPASLLRDRWLIVLNAVSAGLRRLEFLENQVKGITNMRYSTKPFAFLIVTLLIGLAGFQLIAAPFSLHRKQTRKPVKGLQWHSDLNSAHEDSLKTNKPMLLVFHADWCGYCTKLEATTLAEPGMVKYVNTKFVPVHLDLDKEPKIARILEVKSIPCSVVLSPDADLLGKLVGFADSRQYRRTLENTERLHKLLQAHHSR